MTTGGLMAPPAGRHISKQMTLQELEVPVSDRQVSIQGSSHKRWEDDKRGWCGGDQENLLNFSASGHISGYDVSRLHKLGFLSVMRGTLLDSPFLWLQLLGMIVLTLILAQLHIWLRVSTELAEREWENTHKATAAVQTISTFFLGLFLSVVIQRWQALRFNCVGAVYGAAANLCTIAGHTFAGSDPYNRAMRRRTLRYILLAFSLMFTEARNEVDLTPYLDSELLTTEEYQLMSALPRKAACVIGWLLAHFTEHAAHKNVPIYERKLLLENLFRLRGMIADAHMYVGVQLPLPYTAFITLMVKLSLSLICFNTAVELALAYENSDTITAVSSMLQLVLWGVTYQACLDLHSVLSNPFGYDAADYPQSDYFKSCAASCFTQLESETMALAHVRALVHAKADSTAVRRELEMLRTDDDQHASPNSTTNTEKRMHSSLISLQGITPYLQSARSGVETHTATLHEALMKLGAPRSKAKTAPC
mmetsp:Transcript_17040/g.43655  ORF Transcript_17040/g.43655 Transcript_17040/m.43655 type:complete len:479 (+) Transcript_17040:96-1532(+)